MTGNHNLQPIRLSDYRPPAYYAEDVELDFSLEREKTRITNTARYRRAPRTPAKTALRLDGRRLELLDIAIDGKTLAATDYERDETGLTIFQVPGEFTLTVTTLVNPAANTTLEGLYASGSKLCTQCEAHGFSRITFFPDRPDILTRITTRIEADEKQFPVLLSNGNPIAAGKLPGDRHFVRWQDPFPKPVYLFALVAGDLVRLEDEFITMSGRKVAIHFYVEEANRNKCGHAMAALKRAMAWDEREYDREYDLDLYQVVAVDDFNFGAMENKGLNIFNSKYVLAEPESATDSDFEAIESVIAHEYFHNWTGNRITCRDWFQLSLKEGLTVFRDQQYGAWAFPGGGRRIREVRRLRSFQFPEDAGPLAHPVQPKEYVEINNFYTTTIYEKGAEIIRMLFNLLGEKRFKQGMRTYFERYDGQAVTIEDLLAVMAAAGERDLEQFRLWYDQAGTPELTVAREWRAENREYILKISQRTPATPGQPEKRPLHVPLAMALLDREGKELETKVLELRKEREEFSFGNLEVEPLPSLLRGFSAPVKLNCDFKADELAFLLSHDQDPFSRWEAGQQLALQALFELLENPAAVSSAAETLSRAFGRILRQQWSPDQADGISELLLLPDEIYIGELCHEIDPRAIHQAHKTLRRKLAADHQADFERYYRIYMVSGPWRADPGEMACRRLRNLALDYLSTLGPEGPALKLCRQQYAASRNLTDRLAALKGILALETDRDPDTIPELADFFERGTGNPLLRDRWFALQATADRDDTMELVERLSHHDDYIRTNPNRVRALFGSLTLANPAAFHQPDGSGYRLLAREIKALDPLNPQVAARLAGALSRWRRFAPPWRELMHRELENLARASENSRDLKEIIDKSLLSPS